MKQQQKGRVFLYEVVKKLNMKFKDIFSREIRLSREVWDHILKTHPELKGKLDRIKETLISPEIIKRSVHASDVLLFYKYYKDVYGGKYICVTIKILDEDCCISTSYITDRIKKGEIVWKKD